MRRGAILFKSFDLMPEYFTSAQMAEKCHEMGLPMKLSSAGIIGKFLKGKAENGTKYSRNWRKLERPKKPVFGIIPDDQMTEKSCIDFLKKTGKYTITKIQIQKKIEI